MYLEIESILKGSIADELGITPGDRLISVDGEAVIDVLDYRFRVQEEELLVEIEKADSGEVWELEIEKDADEDLGISFVYPLMSEARTCHNKCVFCFIDQQPAGLRETLYVKDDDPRLSFLTGNYVTLTNMGEAEIKRLAGYHLSPLRISVHAADLDLRAEMLKNKNAKKLFDAIDIFNNAGIEMHFQAVICKGLNDGGQLDYTIERLASIKPGAVSLAIVPAGLTQHRQGLFPLAQFEKAEAVAIIEQVEKWQKYFRDTIDKNFVFLADEWYIMAGRDVPAYDEYEDFPQLDNGVGMLRLFSEEFRDEEPLEITANIAIATGTAAAEYMAVFLVNLSNVKIFPIENRFFGQSITVSGLLVGQDIIEQLRGKLEGMDALFLPPNAFRAGTEDMLDGVTRQQVEDALGIPVYIGESDGGLFAKQLKEVAPWQP